MSFVEVDDTGRLRYEQFEKFLRPNTRLVVVTHASNVTGNLTDLAFVSALQKARSYACRGRSPDCGRTAHRRAGAGGGCSLFHRTQGAAGSAGDRRAVCPPGLTMAPLVVGGSGIHSFDETHPSQMPTALEAGTLNVPGLAGLGAGVEWILSQGVEVLHEKKWL